MAVAQPDIAIVGAGFGGLCAAIQLAKAGFTSLSIFDEADRPGGTWQANTYPGAECDVPSHLYSYSFWLKGDWSRKWSPQPEILDYLERCARHYQLNKYLQLATRIVASEFDDESSTWVLHDASGATRRFDFVIFALGQLNRPSRPDISGLDDFNGRCFHSSRWPRDCDLNDKNVAVIGSAASAVQIVPQVARVARHLTVYQRSANWMLRKNNRAYAGIEKWLARQIPGVARLYRLWIWLYAETLVYPLTGRNRLFKRFASHLTKRYLRRTISDDRLRRDLLPDYPFGAKRILFSDDYYAALARDNVSLATSPVTEIGPQDIRCADGARQAVDVIVLATGFKTTDFLAPIRITGRGGRRLEDCWRDGAQAYLGITVAGFPNLFMLYGPNTNLGHSSIIGMLECQARYIVSCVQGMRTRGIKRIEVKEGVQRVYNERLQARLADKVWTHVDNSWYMRAGRNTNNWPGTTVEYRWRTRRCDFTDFETAPKSNP